MNVVFAYMFAVMGAPIGAVLGSIFGIIFALMAWQSPVMGLATGFISMWLSFVFTELVFEWLGVDFGWIAFLCVFLPMALNEGLRVQRATDATLQHEQYACTGTLLAAAVFAGSRFLTISVS